MVPYDWTIFNRPIIEPFLKQAFDRLGDSSHWFPIYNEIKKMIAPHNQPEK